MDSVGPKDEGAHPTLAGNVLDPNVRADGHMASGEGVGGTSESNVRQEGAQHLQNTTGTGSGMSSGESQIHDEGIDHIKSNVGVPSSGEVPSQQAQSGGVLGTMRNYLGLGGKSDEPTQTTSTDDYETSGSGVGGTSNLGESSTGASGSGLGGNETGASQSGGFSGAAAGATGATRATDDTADAGATTSSSDPLKEPPANTNPPADNEVTTGGANNDRSDISTSDGVMSGRERPAGDAEGSLAAHEHKLTDKQTGSARENQDAIPTAGGIKLGSKHWGESQVVSDNPKPRDSEAGISSKDGQPTDQVRDNTQANTGGAAPPSQASSGGSHDKEGLVGQMKDKLHMGKS